MKKILYFLVIITCLHACKQKPASTNDAPTDTADQPLIVRDSTPQIPKPIGMVSDFAGSFTKDQSASLENMLVKYEKRTTNEIGIAIVNSSMVDSAGFDSYTLKMANTWGVGKKGKDNGILVVIAPHLRRMRIQNGYAIEKIFSTEETKQIIDSIFIPEFKKGDYYRGTRNGIEAIIAKLHSKAARSQSKTE